MQSVMPLSTCCVQVQAECEAWGHKNDRRAAPLMQRMRLWVIGPGEETGKEVRLGH